MWRALVVLLIAANLAFWAWSQGWLAPWGFAPESAREPQRMERQIKPEAVQLLTAEEAKQAERLSAPIKPPECYKSGLLDAKQAAAARSLLNAFANDFSFQFEEARVTERWWVFMGPFNGPNAGDALKKKQSELERLNVAFEVQSHNSGRGLVLGEASTPAEANKKLDALTNKGVRTAKVVRERAGSSGERLVLPAVGEAGKARLTDLDNALKAVWELPKGLQRCEAAAP
jgi:hypothetical protein